MSTLPRRLAYLALVLAIGGCGQAAEIGQPVTAPLPTASPTSVESRKPSSPIVRPLRNPDIDPGEPEVLEPGTYVLDRFPVDLAFDIPDGSPRGWHAGRSTADAAIVLWNTPPDITYLFSFLSVDNVYVDPCNAAAGELAPPVGPSVDDLVAALSIAPGLEATAPVGITVGAFQGKEIELTALDSGGDCPEVMIMSAGDDDLDLLSGAKLRLQILDVVGVRIVMTSSPWRCPGCPVRDPAVRDAVAEAELRQILDSIRIERLP